MGGTLRCGAEVIRKTQKSARSQELNLGLRLHVPSSTAELQRPDLCVGKTCLFNEKRGNNLASPLFPRAWTALRNALVYAGRLVLGEWRRRPGEFAFQVGAEAVLETAGLPDPRQLADQLGLRLIFESVLGNRHLGAQLELEAGNGRTRRGTTALPLLRTDRRPPPRRPSLPHSLSPPCFLELPPPAALSARPQPTPLHPPRHPRPLPLRPSSLRLTIS